MLRLRVVAAVAAMLAFDHVIFHVRAEARLFLVPLGASPNAAVSGQDFPITLSGVSASGTLTVAAYLALDAAVGVKGTQITFPCSVSCSGGGSIELVHGSPAYDGHRIDALTNGYVGPTFSVVDSPSCPNEHARLAVACAGPPLGSPIPPLAGIRYLGHASYVVSSDCAGTALLSVSNETGSSIIDEDGHAIPFTADGLSATIPLGRCCDGLLCVGELTESQCHDHSQTGCTLNWTEGLDCSHPCPCVANACCQDDNACTSNICHPTTGACSFPSIVPGGQCCNPSTGILTAIDDQNSCTADVCNALTGEVSHNAGPMNGSTCADDGNPCTLNRCQNGSCASLPISELPCATSADCISATGGVSRSCGQATPGRCDCSTNPSLSIECAAGGYPNPECRTSGEIMTLKVRLGPGSSVVHGAQFRLKYSPSCMAFLGIWPGNTFDDDSPFAVEVFKQISPSSGRIFYAVGVDFLQGGGDAHGGLLACLSFQKIGACTDCDVCFDDANPQHTYLSGDNGTMIVPQFPDGGCGCRARTVGSTVVSHPPSVILPAACNRPTAIHTWSQSFTAVSSCAGLLPKACTCTHSHPLVTPAECNALIAHGGEFPQGVAEFCCESVDECGRVHQGCWTVEVIDQSRLSVSLQLSPTMAATPFTRCIEFAFYPDCIQAPEVFREDVTFGPPFNFPGRAQLNLMIPKGQFACLTARDPVHTLRSMAMIQCGNDGVFRAEFKNDPASGGNWLRGGNLDRNHVINVLDMGELINQYLKPGRANVTCAETDDPEFVDADINADGFVDALDHAFILRNYLSVDKNACCPDPGSGFTVDFESERRSIEVRELREAGLDHLMDADLNGDGVLDLSDFEWLLTHTAPRP